MILEAYYEPQFNSHSHGFRPQRGCHTALRRITEKWRGVKWVADDVLLGFRGPKAEALEIKKQLAQFLRDELAQELNEEKALPKVS